MPTQFAPTVQVPAGTVPEGKVADFLTGRHVRDTPEEYVRQNLEKALVRQYRFDIAQCAPEHPIRVGSARKRIDIAIFHPGKPHTQEHIRLIVETKRPGTKPSSKAHGVDQLQSYMAACLNAEYGIWTNGDDKYAFAKRTQPDGTLSFDEIIDVPANGKTEADAERPRRRDLKPAAADNLLFAFRRCHNYIAGTEGKQKAEAFWELLKLIFCKIEDERSRRLDFYVTPAERNDATAAGSAKHRMQRLFETKVINKYPTIFQGNDSQIDLSANVVAFVVSQLQSFSLLGSPVDVKGVAYEEIVGSNLRGDRGEFFTPRNACRMAVTMLDPQPGELILDPACGTGGFLITAMNHAVDILELGERSEWTNPTRGTDAERDQLAEARRQYLSECVYGMDLNPGLVRAAKMNMVMNNDGSGGLWQANSLAHFHSWRGDCAAAVRPGAFDLIVTNPPFGANIVIDDPQILSQYDTAAKWDRAPSGWTKRLHTDGSPVLQKSQPPEILFIERCVQLLKPGVGRMAMVIPNGILNNPALGYVRHWLLTHTQVLAVVDMARELFQPKNDTQTSMVLVRRLSTDEVHQASHDGLDYPIFMAVTEHIGHDKRGNVLYRRNTEGDDVLVDRSEIIREIDEESGVEVLREFIIRERMIDDDLPEVAEQYCNWLAKQV